MREVQVALRRRHACQRLVGSPSEIRLSFSAMRLVGHSLGRWSDPQICPLLSRPPIPPVTVSPTHTRKVSHRQLSLSPPDSWGKTRPNATHLIIDQPRRHVSDRSVPRERIAHFELHSCRSARRGRGGVLGRED